MSATHPRLAPLSWLRLPRRTARLRLTALYGALFLLSGAALAAITYALFERATEYRPPALPKIPHPVAIQSLQPLSPLATALPGQLKLIQEQLIQAQYQLTQDQSRLGGLPGGPLAAQDQQLIRDQHQLTQDQHQLAQSVHQLAQSVHQLAQAGTVQAAQRAAGPSPVRPGGSRLPACTNAWPSTGRKTSSRNSGTPSTASSRGSKPPSRPNGTSWPTPRTSYAPP